MQISKITQPMFTKAPTMFKAEPMQGDVVEDKAQELKTPENYGRAMVNFKAGTATRILCKQDRALMETLSDTLGLTKDKALQLRQEFKSFLVDNNYKSLNDVKFGDDNEGFFAECEFVGNLTNRIAKKMKLNEIEEDALNMELVKRMDEKEDYIPGGKDYLKEMNMMDHFFRKNTDKIFN